MDNSMLVASVKGLIKDYGRSRILKDINIDIRSLNSSGEIIGCVGPNGAGKTTLLKILAGIVSPTVGKVTLPEEGLIDGSPGIGMVLESAPFVEYLSGYKNLELLGFIKNVVTGAQIKETILRVGLNPDDKKKVKHYSYGMRQRLALAQAIMEKPRLLLLDEPTNGLDAQAIIELRDIITSLAKEDGTAIFLASHLLTEVEKVCDKVLMMKNGRIVKTFDKNSSEQVPVVVEVSSDLDMERLDRWSKENLHIINILTAKKVSIMSNVATPYLIESLVNFGVKIEGVGRKTPSLEEEFISLLGGDV